MPRMKKSHAAFYIIAVHRKSCKKKNYEIFRRFWVKERKKKNQPERC